MRVVLFCENKYAVDILFPLQEYAQHDKELDVLWYVHEKKIPAFPLSEKVRWTTSIQEIYDFSPRSGLCTG